MTAEAIKSPSKPEWICRLPSTSEDVFAGTERELGDKRFLLYIAEGRLLVSVSGKYLSSSLRGAGDVVGMERIQGKVVDYQLWAISDARLERVEVEPLRRVIENLAEPAKSLFMSAMASHDRDSRECDLLREPVLTRLAMFLLDAGDSLVRLPRFVMARALGMRPETLSRGLKELESRGAIALKPRAKIIDAQVLKKIVTVASR